MTASALPCRKRAPIPLLTPPPILVLPFRELDLLRRRLDALCLGDALVFDAERLEWVEVNGKSAQLRLYHGDRIVRACYVRPNVRQQKADLVPTLWLRGWSSACVLVIGGAWGRRRTRRTFAKAE